MPRRLPVIQTPPPEDAEAMARPPWHWVLIGAGFTITLWLPLAYLAVWFQNRALVVFSFVIAALLSGLLVGRFGPRAGPRHVALGGMCGGLFGFALAVLAGGLAPWAVAIGGLLVLAGAGAAFAAIGGVWGRALRRRSG